MTLSNQSPGYPFSESVFNFINQYRIPLEGIWKIQIKFLIIGLGDISRYSFKMGWRRLFGKNCLI